MIRIDFPGASATLNVVFLIMLVRMRIVGRVLLRDFDNGWIAFTTQKTLANAS